MSAPVPVGKQLQIQKTPGLGGTVAKLSGIIDDSFDRQGFLEDLRGIVVFDLEGVTRITSYGVREWMNALRALPSDSYYCFVRARPTLVSQFNMVAKFGAQGQLVTLYSPYHCPACDNDFEVLKDLRTHYAELAEFQTPAAICPKCNATAEFDDIAESYFTYVATTPKPNPPPRANALIDGDSPATSSTFRIAKEIAGEFTFLLLKGEMVRGAHFKRLADGLEGKVVLVLSELTQAKETGVRGFSSFLQVPGLNLTLARMPLFLAQMLAGVPGACGGAQVVSFQLPFRCPAHGIFEYEVAARALKQIPPKLTPPTCPSCNERGQLSIAAEELDNLRQLPLGAATAALTKALQDRIQGVAPEFDTSNDSASQPGGPAKANAFGRYQLVRRIGLGGMAEVFLARQHGPMGFEKRVVLKRILPQHSAQPAFVDMFLQEARLAARISHPNVVQIFDLGRVNDQYFIAMEYVHGRDLALILRVAKEFGINIPVEVACRIVIGICAGLNAAHTGTDDHGRPVVIIHRDISPHNVLVALDGNVKVTDFGIAKIANNGTKSDAGVVKGKINYIAPELFGGDTGQIDGRVDIFAAGIILFQCLTLSLPFFRQTDAGTMRAILQEPVPSMKALKPELPAELDVIVAKALAKAPNDRYPTAKAFELELEQFLQRRPADEPRVSVAEWVESSIATVARAAGDDSSPMSQILAFTPSEGGSEDDETSETDTAPKPADDEY